VPSENGTIAFSAKVFIQLPNGTKLSALASFNAEHFKYIGGKSECKVTVSIKDTKKDKIEVGSEILVDQETMNRIGYHG
jgi:hypothetical protein